MELCKQLNEKLKSQLSFIFAYLSGSREKEGTNDSSRTNQQESFREDSRTREREAVQLLTYFHGELLAEKNMQRTSFYNSRELGWINSQRSGVSAVKHNLKRISYSIYMISSILPCIYYDFFACMHMTLLIQFVLYNNNQ